MKCFMGWLLPLLVPTFAFAHTNTSVHQPVQAPARTMQLELQLNDNAIAGWSSIMPANRVKWGFIEMLLGDAHETDLIEEAIDNEAMVTSATLVNDETGGSFLRLTLAFTNHEQMIKASTLIENAFRDEAPVTTSLIESVKQAFPQVETESLRYYLDGNYETQTRTVVFSDSDSNDDEATAMKIWQRLGFPMRRPFRYKKSVGLSVFFFQLDNVQFGIFVNRKKFHGGNITGDTNADPHEVNFGITMLITF